MKINFTKMNGCGNDYIYINCMEEELILPEKLLVKLSDRHFGIGGDGVVLICDSKIADSKMRMFNADGSEGKMCGNAIRCVAKYLYDNKIIVKKFLEIETLSGIKKLNLETEKEKVTYVTVDMGKAEIKSSMIPVISELDEFINQKISIADREYYATCVSMGNPHCVVFCKDIDNLELEKIGPKFEFNKLFPDRINTEFVEIINESTIKMRVWERGSGETLACGTGACASVVASCLNGYCKEGDEVKVKLKGGDLSVIYTKDRVLLKGTANKNFEGVVELEDIYEN